MPFEIPVPHLIGKTVQIMADGVVLPEQVVSPEGTVTVDSEPVKAFIGLAYTSLFQTLPITIQLQNGDSQGMLKRPSEIWLRTYRSINADIAPVENYEGVWEPLTESGRYRISDHASPLPDEIGDLEDWRFNNPGQNDSAACFAVRQTKPLPLVVLAATALFSVSEK